MPSRIKPKRSYTANAVPTTSDLETNELAIRWDASSPAIFTKNAAGNIVSVTLGGSGGGAGSLSGSVTIPGLGDAAFGNVAMLLHMDGTGGTFVDSSGTPKSITAVGNATQSATQSKFGGKSLSCPAGGYLSVDGGTDVSFGSGDFTVELWAYPTETPNGSALYTSEYSDDTVGFTIAFSNSGTLGSVSGATLFTGFFNGSWLGIATSNSLTLNAWNHIAVTRISGQWSLYLNGTRIGTTSDTTVMPTKPTVWIGKDWGAANATTGSFVGFIEEVRVTKGVARYSGAGLIVPTAAFANSSSLTLPVTVTGSGGGGTGSIGGGSDLTWSSVPASATATGTAGQIAYDAEFLYACIATDTWRRTALSTWQVFSPNSITGLQLWLDASDAGTLFDATSGGSLVAADGAVARWQDKSGNSRHFTQATSGSRPTRKTAQQNGLATLLFDGVNDVLNGPDFLDLNTGSMHAFLVYKRNATGARHELLSKTDTDGVGYIVYQASDGKITFRSQQNVPAGGTQRETSASVTASAYTVVTLAVTSGSVSEASFRRNATALTMASAVTSDAGAQTPSNTNGLMRIGAQEYAGDFYFLLSGNVAEVILYNAALSDTDRSAVESYLMSKWGIT